MKYSKEEEEKLMARLWSPLISTDPYAFVMFAFPWGQKGTPLEKFKGPRRWQKERLFRLRDHIRANGNRLELGLIPKMLKDATVSGRGSGKSAFCAWMILFAMTCFRGGTVIVTANTESQLKSKTWAELGVWHTMSINEHWFDRSALSLVPRKWYKEAIERELQISTSYYYAQAQLWSKETPGAFAGAHNPKGMMVIFDEASNIDKPIWVVTQGFFTEPDPYRFWLVFSNGRENTGAFFDCFHDHRLHWNTFHLNSLELEGPEEGGPDKAIYHDIIAEYGEDSDEARVEVYGQFPVLGESQLIGWDVVDDAGARDLRTDHEQALIMGVDVGRGGDETVIRWRQGRDGRTIYPQRFKIRDDMKTADKVAEWIDATDPDAVVVDAGNGTGVIDRLRQMNYKVHEIWFNGTPEDSHYANLRTEMWYRMRDWLHGGCVDKLERLQKDLTGPRRVTHKATNKPLLESKDDMKGRGLKSPNDGDALALTFAVRVAKRDLRVYRGTPKMTKVARDVDYDVFSPTVE